MNALLHFTFLLLSLQVTASFEWSATGRHPEVDRLALAGLWRLTPRIGPMKEFTVYPKQPPVRPLNFLLMLKEDGSFQQYKNDEVDVDASWSKFRMRRKAETLEAVTKGTWDFVDGKLILAADRLESEKQTSSQEDKLLVGRVVATYESSLEGNPVLKKSLDQKAQGTQVEPPPKNSFQGAVDAHLSVPRGSLKIGRFMYPKNHPSFFEQPMFQPTVRRQAFSLQQVLGSLNAKQRSSEEVVEKYKHSDFYNKTFLLTSHPLPQRKLKGRKRWSIKLNKFVEDPPSKEAQKAQEEEEKSGAVPIRVMQIVFHRNHTFSTVAGLGESILRGKWDVIGQEKDQLWLQVWMFGFGRSVSGSTYSEGKFLSQDDAKCYWGTIRPEGVEDDNKQKVDLVEVQAAAEEPVAPTGKAASENNKPQRLEVEGSVMFGWGLEPLPVGRFIMREVTQLDLADDEEEEEDEGVDDDDGDSAILGILEEGSSNLGPDLDGIDWSDSSDEAFQ